MAMNKIIDGKLYIAINHLIPSHVYSSRNMSKAMQLNIFLNLPPHSVLEMLLGYKTQIRVLLNPQLRKIEIQ